LKSELPEHRIAVFIFDRRGSGASEGDFETADFEDLAAMSSLPSSIYNPGQASACGKTPWKFSF